MNLFKRLKLNAQVERVLLKQGDVIYESKHQTAFPAVIRQKLDAHTALCDVFFYDNNTYSYYKTKNIPLAQAVLVKKSIITDYLQQQSKLVEAESIPKSWKVRVFLTDSDPERRVDIRVSNEQEAIDIVDKIEDALNSDAVSVRITKNIVINLDNIALCGVIHD